MNKSIRKSKRLERVEEVIHEVKDTRQKIVYI